LWGETRLRAARAVGWHEIEVVLIEDVDDRRALVLGIRENMHRRDFTFGDKLNIIAELHALGLNGKEIAAATPISASDVSRLPRIAERSQLWDACRAGTLTVREAQELLTLSDDELGPLLATIAARRAGGEGIAIVAELRPLVGAVLAERGAAAAQPLRAARRPVPPLARIERGIAVWPGPPMTASGLTKPSPGRRA